MRKKEKKEDDCKIEQLLSSDEKMGSLRDEREVVEEWTVLEFKEVEGWGWHLRLPTTKGDRQAAALIVNLPLDIILTLQSLSLSLLRNIVYIYVTFLN